MKNSIKLLVAIVAVLTAFSCNDQTRSSASYFLGVSFETAIEENPAMKDSIVSAPYYSWDQVIYFKSSSTEVNTDYQGGFMLSAKKGSADDSNSMSRFVSASPDAGVGKSSGYIAFLQTGSMPDYDIKLELSSFYSASASITGCYICNSESTRRFAEEEGFEPGDYLKVTFEFFYNDMSVGSLDKYLVDYVTDTELKMVNDWEVWDMSEEETKVSIPSFDSIRIRMETSRPEIERCFCMDEFTIFLNVEY